LKKEKNSLQTARRPTVNPLAKDTSNISTSGDGSDKEEKNRTLENSQRGRPNNNTHISPIKSGTLRDSTTQKGNERSSNLKNSMKEIVGIEKNARFFGSSTTSTKPVEEIAKQLLSALSNSGIIVQTIKTEKQPNTGDNTNTKTISDNFHYKCKAPSGVTFQIELVDILNFANMRGLKLLRTSGDIWAYKNLVDNFISKLKL